MPFLSGPALYLAAALGLFALGMASGWRVESWRCGAAETKAITAALAERDSEAKRANAAESVLITAQEAQRVEYRTIRQTVDRIVERPVYRDRSCFDDDLVRTVNRAAGVAAADPAGTPHGTLPGPPAAR